jgi:hypothetical protein
MKPLSLLPILWLLLIVSCGKPNEEAPSPTRPEKNGLGSSKSLPDGLPLQLPPGIELINDPIPHYDPNECGCKKEQKDCHKGSGYGVRLCLGFRNTTSQPVKITFPVGLLFVSFDTEVQNGLLIQVETFEVPTYGTANYEVMAYCANAGRSAGSFGDFHRLGPVVNDAEFDELFELLKNKDVSNYDLPDDPDISSVAIIQNAVWDITDQDGLTDWSRGWLKRLRDK